MTDEANKSDAEKTWENLSKEYLTTDQKIAIIREHNMRLSDEAFKKCIESLREWVEKRKND